MHKPTVILKEKPRSVAVPGRKCGPKVTLKRQPEYFYGYHISAHYRKVTVWIFDAFTRKRIGVDTRTINPGVPKHERGPILARFLKNFGLTLS